LTLFPFRYTFSPVSATSPLRLLAASKPERARSLIRGALRREGGHRGRAADRLAPKWLPGDGSTQRRYFLLWKTIVALDMGEEVRKRWPAPSDPRGQPAAEPVEEESLGSYYMLGRGGSGPAPEKVRRTRR
jgi:hypothetical protein